MEGRTKGERLKEREKEKQIKGKVPRRWIGTCVQVFFFSVVTISGFPAGI